ncbi:hypothetical protein TNCV_5135421 [Trichonephila clavipes]|nr:hypothetical protein TNCV_5135421 [Trichonephila clavipes]
MLTDIQCRFIHWALGVITQGTGEAQKGPDKLDLTRFSGYKFRSSSDKGLVDLLRLRPEIGTADIEVIKHVIA